MAASSFLEITFALGVAAIVAGIGTAEGSRALDEARGASAARYLSGRLQQVRMESVTRGAAAALRVTPTSTGYSFVVVIDGNGNGVLARDITNGIDRTLTASESLGDRFAGVEFGALPGVPPVDPAGIAPGIDPIRLGTSNSATFTPYGTSSPGSLYLLTRGGVQFAIRIYAETGKTRVLRFNRSSGQWMPIAGA
jgi:hypothetical protein